jgi:hypothetical protein
LHDAWWFDRLMQGSGRNSILPKVHAHVSPRLLIQREVQKRELHDNKKKSDRSYLWDEPIWMYRHLTIWAIISEYLHIDQHSTWWWNNSKTWDELDQAGIIYPLLADWARKSYSLHIGFQLSSFRSHGWLREWTHN